MKRKVEKRFKKFQLLLTYYYQIKNNIYNLNTNRQQKQNKTSSYKIFCYVREDYLYNLGGKEVGFKNLDSLKETINKFNCLEIKYMTIKRKQ